METGLFVLPNGQTVSRLNGDALAEPLASPGWRSLIDARLNYASLHSCHSAVQVNVMNLKMKLERR